MNRRGDPIHGLLKAYLGLVVLFMASPLIFVVVNSLNSTQFSKFPPEGLSLRWYEVVFSVPAFGDGLRNSIVVALGATAMSVTAGTLAALALVRYRFPGREVLRSLFVAPLVFPRVALGLAAYILFLRIADLLHLREVLLGTPISIMLVHSLLGLPLVIVILSATLIGLDPSIEEAAMDLGANPLQTFLRVTFPLVRQAMAVAAVFAFMFSFDEVETSFFLAPVAGRTLPVEMFLYLERQQTPAVAALSSLLLLGTAIFVFILASRMGIERLTRVMNRH